ncbi:unnamed protein product [Rhizophagus irregularis]|nr:unnamed protein product [Rhizophagus irregularis]
MTEARNQFHQRSKSLNNKGKRGFSYSHQQKVKETTISSSSSSDYSRNTNKNFSNYNNFDSSYHREQNVGFSNNNINNNFWLIMVLSVNCKEKRVLRIDLQEDINIVILLMKINLESFLSSQFLRDLNLLPILLNLLNTKSVSSLDVTKEEQIERRRSDVTPSRSKHTQRKEIKSIGYETDLVLNNQQLSEDTYSNSDDNITIKSSLANKNYIESTPRRLSSTAIELQSQVSRFASDSDSDSPRRPGGAPKLYAGPTFHNSPAPSDLPMPSFFGKSSLPKESSPLSVNNLFTVPENMSSVQSSPYYYSQTSTLRKQTSQELLRILSATNTRQHQTAAAYMVPERMATAHNPMHVYPFQ